MTDKEKIEILEGILDDFDTAATELDDTVNTDKATDVITRSNEFGKFLDWCCKKSRKYNLSARYARGVGCDYYDRSRQENYMSKAGKDVCLHLAYPLYICPGTLEMLSGMLPIMPNQIDLTTQGRCNGQDFHIDDIDNVNPSTTFKNIIAGTTTIHDARTITDMDFVIKTDYNENGIFIVDSFHQSLKIDRCNVRFETSSYEKPARMLFKCPVIPAMSGLVTDAKSLGFYDSMLFSNKRNQKFFDLFEWNTSWSAPDGKTIIMKKFEDLEKIFDVGHKALKKYLDEYDKWCNHSYYGRTPTGPSKPTLTAPLTLSKNAKLSDVINISGFSDLGGVMFSNGELTIEFNRKDKHSGSWYSDFEIPVGQTLDGWFVYVSRDQTTNKHRGAFGGW